MGEEDYYLELCERPVHFEKANPVNCVFFDEANKQVFAVRSGGATGVDFSNFTPDSPQLEYTQECKVLPEKRNLKLLKSQNINVNWYMYCPESAVILLSTTVLGNVLQPFYFRAGTMSKLPKFEIELPAAPKSTKLSLSERDIAMATIEGACKKMHILKLNRTGKFALNVVDNLVVVHHQDTETSVIFDIKLRGEFDGTVTLHHPVLPARSIQPYQIPVAGPAPVTSQSPIPCKLYSSSWIVFQPDIIISASQGYLWNLQVKLQPVVNLLPDKGRLMDFLLQRRECKTVVLSVCSQMLTESDRATLPVVATVFDKLNQEYKKYLDAEQSYTLALEAGQSRSGPLLRRPARTQAVVDQSDMYTHVLSAFTEKKEMPQKFVVAVLMEYIRSLNQFQITVQHYLHELVIKTLVQHNLFYTLHQFLQYHVLSDSKPLENIVKNTLLFSNRFLETKL
ncbi:hypothetical protein J1605_015161 [Eschrichtius robustus]|uniref:Mic1 domain-containing protein n=1 Tax=Eschrichtius robustus TaxID=9764 RepID=A0AB34GBT5_ESCRO|nr:hypothetical protein J1605_015161 [Eschrichtius robustus]